MFPINSAGTGGIPKPNNAPTNAPYTICNRCVGGVERGSVSMMVPRNISGPERKSSTIGVPYLKLATTATAKYEMKR